LAFWQHQGTPEGHHVLHFLLTKQMGISQLVTCD